jgi:hypothetical protein
MAEEFTRAAGLKVPLSRMRSLLLKYIFNVQHTGISPYSAFHDNATNPESSATLTLGLFQGCP